MYMDILLACMPVYNIDMQCPWRSEEEIRSPGIELPAGLSHLVGAGNLNPGPQQEQPMLLTAEPSPQPLQS